jgi:hypothetical protein
MPDGITTALNLLHQFMRIAVTINMEEHESHRIYTRMEPGQSRIFTKTRQTDPCATERLSLRESVPLQPAIIPELKCIRTPCALFRLRKGAGNEQEEKKDLGLMEGRFVDIL